MTRHPLSNTMARAQAAGDALRALVVRQATEPDLTDQQRLELSVALDGVKRAVERLRGCSDRAVQASAGRLVAALAAQVGAVTTCEGDAAPGDDIRRGDYVRFDGATDLQARWRSTDDPRPHFRVGEVREVASVEVGSDYTHLQLVGCAGLEFNSVCFTRVRASAAEG